MLECWVFEKEPIFHNSNIPATFWQNVNAVFIKACHAKNILDTNDFFLLFDPC